MFIKPLPGKETKINYWADRLNLPRALQASFDLSAPFRQGVGLIHKQAWWRSWDDMVKSFGSEKTYKDIMDSITSDELFKPRAYFKEVPVKGGVKKVAMVDPSYADEAGLALTDLAHINSREEALASNLAEKFFDIPVVQPLYAKTIGRECALLIERIQPS